MKKKPKGQQTPPPPGKILEKKESSPPVEKPPQKTEKAFQSQDRQEEARSLYQEGVKRVQRLYDKVRQDETFSLEENREFVNRVINFMARDGDELLLFVHEISREGFLYVHANNVLIFALKVGIELRYDQKQLLELGLTAFLHDIGVAKVPEEIMNKPEKLTQKEFELIKQHPVYAINFLKKTQNLEPIILQAISQEHERIDGSGYPEGISGEAIVRYGKILGVVDVYEALTHSRPHREPHPPDEAIRIIAYSMKDHFEASIVEVLKALVKALHFYPVGSFVELGTGEIGRVIRVNARFPLLPVVELLIGSGRKPIEKPKQVDLSKTPLIYIKSSVGAAESMAILKGNPDAAG